MKNKIVLIYDDYDDKERRKQQGIEIGYIRLLIAIFGGDLHVMVKKTKKIKLDKREIPEKFMV